MGELSSLSKILSVLCADEKTEVVLTGTTSTGLLMADKKYRNQVLAQGPFPLDWWIFSCMAWSKIKPDLIITVDSELWPEHFHQAAIRGVPALVINARLSDRTFSRLSASPIARKLLLPRGIEILTTSENQRSRWLELGLPKDRVQVVGNLKVDAITPSEKAPNTPAELKKEFGFSNDSLVLAGISTWPGEEELLVETLQALHAKEIDARLLLVPRHAERRAKIAAMLQQSGVAHHLRTSSNEAPEGTLIYLADTTGELGNLIRCADLAFGGKTLPPTRVDKIPSSPSPWEFLWYWVRTSRISVRLAEISSPTRPLRSPSPQRRQSLLLSPLPKTRVTEKILANGPWIGWMHRAPLPIKPWKKSSNSFPPKYASLLMLIDLG